MNYDIQFEDRVSRSRSKHEGESSASLCDRLSLTRVQSQRQLPTDHDYAVPTREYQLDQSSPLPATAAADLVQQMRAAASASAMRHWAARAWCDGEMPFDPQPGSMLPAATGLPIQPQR